MSNKKLIIIFVVLLALYLLSRVFMGKKQSTFDPQVIAVDTSIVTQIKLYPKAESGAEIVLQRNTDGWTATKDGRTVKTPYSKISGLLSTLMNIEAQRIVSKSAENWGEYEVDEKGSRVAVYNKGSELADFVVGTFKFDQAKRSASSYLRLADGDAVYLVDGFMSMTFNQGFNAFRNSSVINLPPGDIREIAVQAGGERIAINKNPEDGRWYRGGMELLDSAIVARYISSIANTSGTHFSDDEVPGGPMGILEISANNQAAPVSVEYFVRQDSLNPFLFRSSANPDAVFESDSSGLYQRLFVKFEDLLTSGE